MTNGSWPDVPGRHVFAWPSCKNIRVTAVLALAFAVFWLVVYGGANVVTGLHSIRISVHMSWELQVPFIPELAVVYLSMNVMMLLSLFVFRTWQEFVPLLTVLVVQTLLAGACFLLLPVQPALPGRLALSTAGWLFHGADALNLEFNSVPSLHVAYAFTTARAIGARCTPVGKGMFLLWAGAIAVSTLFLHQHYCVDIIAGIALAVLTMQWLYDRASNPAFLRTVRAEMLCLGELYRFSCRHLRYLVVGMIIYWYSLFRWRGLRAIRVGFCVLQHLDDILDGDRPCPIEPTEIADDMLRQMETGEFDDSRLASLACCLWEEMGRFHTAYDHPRREILTLVRLMRRDRLRVREQCLLSSTELAEHHRQTFYYAVNLMLTLGGAEIRARDVPDLIAAFGWCSTIRDLREDLTKGLVNLPASVINAARVQGLSKIEYAALVQAPAVKQWLQDEYCQATQHLIRCEQDLHRLQSKRGIAILRLFHRSMQRFAVQAAQRYGW